MSLEWSENDIFRFLKEYREHECLWNPQSADYYDCFAKNNALREISERLKITCIECQRQIKIISKKYEEEQSKILCGLRTGEPYESNVLWYSLMEAMLKKTILNGNDVGPKVTSLLSVCKCSVADKAKSITLNKKKKTKSNVLSPANRLPLNSACGKSLKKKITPTLEKSLNKTLLAKQKKRQSMCTNRPNYVQCPSFKTEDYTTNLIRRLEEGKAAEKSSPTNLDRSETSQQNVPLVESTCVREIKRRKDIPKSSISQSKLPECPCGLENSTNNNYTSKENYSTLKNLSTNMIPCPSYFSQPKNTINYNDYSYRESNNQNRFRTRFVPCPNSPKPPDDPLNWQARDQSCLYSQRNPYNNYSKNFESNSSPVCQTYCSNKFDSTVEIYPQPRKISEIPEHDTNVNRQSCVRKSVNVFAKSANELPLIPEINEKNLFSLPDDQSILQFTPKVATKFENGVFEAYSQFKISVQYGEKGQRSKRSLQSASQETQTAFERKQQGVCTNRRTFDTKEVQSVVDQRSKQTEMGPLSCTNREVQNTVCVSSAEAAKNAKDLSDFILLTPEGKYVRLVQRSTSNENFVECTGASDRRRVYSDNEGETYTVCADGLCYNGELKVTDSDTIATSHLIQTEEECDSNEKSSEALDCSRAARAENRELEEEESISETCQYPEDVDEGIQFCYQNLFNKDLSTMDCLPCLKEKSTNKIPGQLTKTLLSILKVALDLDSRAECNKKGCKLKAKSKAHMGKRISRCADRFQKIVAEKRSLNKSPLNEVYVRCSNKGSIPKHTPTSPIEGTKKLVEVETSFDTEVAREVETEKESPVSRTASTSTENGQLLTKEVETERETLVSRSMSTIAENDEFMKDAETEHELSTFESANSMTEEVPIEENQAFFDRETSTDFSKLRSDVKTSMTSTKLGVQDAATQDRLDASAVPVKSKSAEGQNVRSRDVSPRSGQENVKKCSRNREGSTSREHFEASRKPRSFSDFQCGKECKNGSINYDWSKVRLSDAVIDKFRRKAKKIIEDRKVADQSQCNNLSRKIRKI